LGLNLIVIDCRLGAVILKKTITRPEKTCFPGGLIHKNALLNTGINGKDR